MGLLSFPPQENQFDKPYSDETARLIDEEVRAFVGGCYDRTLQLIADKRHQVEALAKASWANMDTIRRPSLAGRPPAFSPRRPGP